MKFYLKPLRFQDKDPETCTQGQCSSQSSSNALCHRSTSVAHIHTICMQVSLCVTHTCMQVLPSLLLSQGDTLYSISRRYRTTVEAILEINRITDANVIFAGMVDCCRGRWIQYRRMPFCSIPTWQPRGKYPTDHACFAFSGDVILLP